MLEFKFSSNDPTTPMYYYSLILSLVVTMLSLKILSYLLKKKSNDETDLESSMLPNIVYSKEFVRKKDSLKVRYLICYVLTKANIWAKTAYLWTLYNKYHGFTINEIAILYLIDNVSALITGPISGNMADIFGRKKFCLLYCFLVITNLTLRLTGSKPLAYVAQILTGISAALINTTFESWVNYEASKEFEDKLIEKERFLKKLFKMQTLLDALVSVAASMLSAIFYNLFGITAPIIISMCFALSGIISISLLWDENSPNRLLRNNFKKSFLQALNELKKREVLSIGLIEGLFHGVLTIFIFAWTPILQLSTESRDMNLGSVSICFVIMLINGTILYEILIIHFNFNLFLGLSLAVFMESMFCMIVFYYESFWIRLIFLSCINGFSGFVNPLNSIIKSKLLEEKNRALLMNFFRMPLNAYVIITLLVLKYINPVFLCIICAVLVFIASIIGLSMVIWPPVIAQKVYSTDEEIEEIVEEMIEREDATDLK